MKVTTLISNLVAIATIATAGLAGTAKANSSSTRMTHEANYYDGAEIGTGANSCKVFLGNGQGGTPLPLGVNGTYPDLAHLTNKRTFVTTSCYVPHGPAGAEGGPICNDGQYDQTSSWNKSIKSVLVAPGCELDAWDQPNYKGNKTTYPATDVPLARDSVPNSFSSLHCICGAIWQPLH